MNLICYGVILFIELFTNLVIDHLKLSKNFI